MKGNAYMANAVGRNGSQIASVEHHSSLNAQVVTIAPNTIVDVLTLLEDAGTKGIPMLRTASGVLATYVGVSAHRLTIQMVFDAKDLFRTYLVSRKYAEN